MELVTMMMIATTGAVMLFGAGSDDKKMQGDPRWPEFKTAREPHKVELDAAIAAEEVRTSGIRRTRKSQIQAPTTKADSTLSLAALAKGISRIVMECSLTSKKTRAPPPKRVEALTADLGFQKRDPEKNNPQITQTRTTKYKLS